MTDNYSRDSSPCEVGSLGAPIVAAARTGDYAGAARLLNRLLQTLQRELSKGRVAASDLSKITYSLETLLAMQEMKNWVAFADILEYEFLPLWQRLGGGPPVSRHDDTAP
ncbi:MAG: hypothetical protein JXA18_04170 [Chitinispirillaceae bacterium]|nr:hypothetical protein [Chitinispirillaceae bacterium]